MKPGVERFKRSTQWTKTSASDENRLRAVVEDLQRATIAEGTGQAAQSVGAVPLNVPRRDTEFWIKILGPPEDDGSYRDWVEVAQVGNGDFVEPADPLVGTKESVVLPAYEIDRARTPPGSICRAYFSRSEPLSVLFIRRNLCLWARITGRSGLLYSWQEVRALSPAGPYLAVPNGRSGTFAGGGQGPGREVNDVTVAVGTIVHLCRSDTGHFWEFEYCCGTLPGSGSGLGCIPGVCAECEDPPYEWALPVGNAFTGPCQVFNGDWTLSSLAECVWKAAALVSGVSVTVTITREGDTYTLEFLGIANGVLVASATFTAEGDADCCVPLEFAVDECSCGSAHAGTDCTQCDVMPVGWLLESAPEFEGCYRRFVGPFYLPFDDEYAVKGCTWSYYENQVRIYWRIQPDGSAILDMVDEAAEPLSSTVEYTSAPFAPDCCSPVTATRSYAMCATEGNTPDTLTLTPFCEGGSGPGQGDCPDTLTATPACCGTGSGGSGGSGPTSGPGGGCPDLPVCDCPVCPQGAPPMLAFVTPEADGEWSPVASVSWELCNEGGGCVWTQEHYGISATFTLSGDDGLLVFVDSVTGSTWTMGIIRPFDCCGSNVVTHRSHDSIGSVDDLFILTPNGPCEGECDEEPPDSGGGSGGSGGGGDNLGYPCCDEDLPEEMTATVSGVALCSPCADTSVPLTYDGALNQWRGTGPITCGSGQTLYLAMECLEDGLGGRNWHMAARCDGYGDPSVGTMAQSGGSCAPFSQTFNGLGMGLAVNGCDCPTHINIVVTE